jgi:hypothetical protein
LDEAEAPALFPSPQHISYEYIPAIHPAFGAVMHMCDVDPACAKFLSNGTAITANDTTYPQRKIVRIVSFSTP